jgi:hypothetical protein
MVLRRVLRFLVIGLREFGFAQICVLRPPDARPGFRTSPGHPEEVIPLALLPQEERQRWKDLEKNLW